jgi:uncharacterized protein YerC
MAWGQFRKIIVKSGSEKVFMADMERFFTPSEIVLIEKRLLISLLLRQGLSYRKISEILDVTRVTISFVKHGLKKAPRVRKHVPDKIRKQKRESEIPYIMSPTEHLRRLRRRGIRL